MTLKKRVAPEKDSKAPKPIDYKKAFRQIAATRAGRDVLHWLMTSCGYKETGVVIGITTTVLPDGRQVSTQGDVLMNSTLYNSARKDVYIGVRGMIPVKQLNEIEREDYNARNDEEGPV